MTEPEPRSTGPSSTARRQVVSWILLLTAASFLYRLLVLHQLEQTSALFIGIPAVLAIVTALFSKPKTATGTIMAIMTIALCISGVFLGEGFVCIVMSAPLFYLIGGIVGIWIDRVRNRRQKNTLACCLAVLCLPLSFEGVTPGLSFSRNETVSVERVVNSDASRVGTRLSQSPDISQPLPLFLRGGFPIPVYAHGSGLNVGDIRRIHFAGGEGHPGDLELTVVESSPGRVVFRATSDHSKIAHWLAWRSAVVEWKAIDARRTQVRWTLSYRRDLDPVWYFGPWERYAVARAAEYLIRTNAGPLEEK
jgi:hypothetical protein